MGTKAKRMVFGLVAALVAGSASMASANEVLDTTTGLRTEFYYAPIAQLERQGAPISARARQYLREQGAASAAVPNGLDALAQAPVVMFEPGPSNEALAFWGNQHQRFDSSGAPTGPY